LFFEHGLGGVSVEAGLEFGEEFTEDGGDVRDADHGEHDALGTGIRGDLGSGPLDELG